jgi:HAD superfamily hydrolase (TIGR01549 family)
MRATRKVEFVFFDHGGTLICQKKDSPQIFLEVLAESGHSFTLEHVRDAMEKADRYWEARYQQLPRGHRFNDSILEDWHKKLLGHLGLERGVDELATKIISEWHERAGFVLHPDALPCLEALRGHGLPMGIITQTLLKENEFRRLHLSSEGIEHYFDLVLTTESIGYDKPDKRLYLKAIDLAVHAPQEIMHVGDSYELDVKGAESAGMRAVLLIRDGRATQYDCETIGSLIQLKEIIDL